MTPLGLPQVLVVSGGLFSIGLFLILTRRNAVRILMGIELVLNSANLNLIGFARFGTLRLDAHVFALFVIIIAASEAAVALGIVLALFEHLRTIDVDQAGELKG